MNTRHIISTGLAALSVTALTLIAGCRSEPVPVEAVVADVSTVRTTPQGELIGFIGEDGVRIWRGIPFAKAPKGELRWRAPRPAEPWGGRLDALDFGPRCPQITNALDQGEGLAPGELVGSEDCLTLNIYTPADDGTGPWPVMLWIHGGGNVWGRASQFDGTRLAADQKVVVVTIQYRLGPLGWLAHGALRGTGETQDDLSANFGTLDIIASLEWVRDQIGIFGGDPSRVTVFGESAGGHNVASLIGSPRAEGLFHRAILQSGSFRSVPLDVAEGVSGSRPGAARPMVRKMLSLGAGADDDYEDDTLIRMLQALSLETVFAPYQAGASGLINIPRVINDGIVIPMEGLMEATGTPGGFNAVPIMSGTNRDETKLFNFLNPDYVSSLFGLVYWAKDPLLYDVISDYQSVVWRVRAVDDAFERFANAGHEALYGYRFDWDEQSRFLFTDFSKLVGAAHAIEIPFVFNRYQFFGGAGDSFFFTKDNKPGRDAVSAAMGDAWGRFAHTGNPSPDGEQGPDSALPDWPAYGSGRVMVFDSPADGGMRMVEGRERVASVLKRLESDARLETQDQRCTVLNAVIAWHPELAPFRADFLSGACPAAG